MGTTAPKSLRNGKFHILTLGCPKNRVDSEDLLASLLNSGLRNAESPEEADLVLVNTCGFIEDAKRESIEEILRIAEGKRGEQKIVVFGCLAQRYGEELRRELPEVDAFFGVNRLGEIVEFCKTTASAPAPPGPAGPARPTGSHAYLKIADGCNRGCSFCAIPSIKGRAASLPPEKVLRKAEELVNAGTRELILVAQDITSYGKEFRDYGLSELIRDLSSLPGDFWIRLLYLFPTDIGEGLLRAIAENGKVCRYLDIPLQHSEGRILGLMRRAGSREAYEALVGRIRGAIPDVTIRTSFIVGFPSESDEEFDALLRFVHEMEFERVGAFIYSREEGTAAHDLEGHIPEEVKRQRYHELMTLQAGISLRKNRSMLDRIVRVMVDEVSDAVALCRYEGQAPEIDGMVIVKGVDGRAREGEFMDVRITEAQDYDLVGEPL